MFCVLWGAGMGMIFMFNVTFNRSYSSLVVAIVAETRKIRLVSLVPVLRLLELSMPIFI